MTFLYHGPLTIAAREHLLPPSPKMCWTMTTDNVGLKTCLLGISSSMIILTFFFLM
jgi:hypothetical protein